MNFYLKLKHHPINLNNPMDHEFETEILSRYLSELFKKGKVKSKKLTEDICDYNMWDDSDPECTSEIREHIRCIKNGQAFISTKKIIITYDYRVKVIETDNFITLDQILKCIKYPEKFIELEPLSDGSYNICYDTDNEDHIIVTHEETPNIEAGYFIITKKHWKKLQKKASKYKDILDEKILNLVDSMKIHDIKKQKRISDKYQQSDYGITLIVKKLNELH
jgi:hypothetical protein